MLLLANVQKAENEVSWATQLTVDRLKMFDKLLARWSGPVSAALYSQDIAKVCDTCAMPFMYVYVYVSRDFCPQHFSARGSPCFCTHVREHKNLNAHTCCLVLAKHCSPPSGINLSCSLSRNWALFLHIASGFIKHQLVRCDLRLKALASMSAAFTRNGLR
jgi:hypothetical protein